MPQVNHLGVIVGERCFRSAEFHALVKCQPDSLGLAYADFAAFLFGGVGKQFKDNAANHVFLKVGFLFRVKNGRVDYHNVNAHALNVEPFVLDCAVIPAEPVHFFDYQRVAGSEHLVLQDKVSLALKILAGLLVRNDVTLLNAVFQKCPDLPVKVLLRA